MIDAHALPARGPPIDQRTALRQEAILRILRIEPRFNGVTAQHQLMLIERQLFPRGYVQLPGDEIKTRDRLGDCVLDLKAGIHLEEIEISGRVEQKLDGAGADIADSACRRDRRLAHLRPQFRRDRRRRRFLDDFLMPALDRAIAFAEVDDVAVLISEDLKLNMARVAYRAF